jgi:uncharacterized protein
MTPLLIRKGFIPTGLRWLRSIALVAIAILALSGPAWATAAYELPRVSAGDDTWLLDESESISLLSEKQISGRLRQLAKATGQEVRIVSFRRLDYEETIQTFTKQLFETWYPTPEEQANQTLFTLDVITNTIGVQVGPEAQAKLTPELIQSITDETMRARIKNEDQYNQAWKEACDRIIPILSGEPDPGPPAVVEAEINVEGTFASKEETDSSNAPVIVLVLLILATIIPMATYWWYVKD